MAHDPVGPTGDALRLVCPLRRGQQCEGALLAATELAGPDFHPGKHEAWREVERTGLTRTGLSGLHISKRMTCSVCLVTSTCSVCLVATFDNDVKNRVLPNDHRFGRKGLVKGQSGFPKGRRLKKLENSWMVIGTLDIPESSYHCTCSW